MAIRRAKKKAAKPKAKKATKTVRKSTVVKKVKPKGHWRTYHLLQKQVNQAWDEFQSSVKKKARPEVVARTKNHLMLLLGECNFMAQQCMRLASRAKKR